MVRLLGLSRFGGDEAPREITRTNPVVGEGGSGENGWLIRFFDSAFFCEWIAVSYLYKHEHPGVRDYLCNRMYTLPLAGLENYLFQICYMLVHKPSPSLDKFVIDTCSKSLRIALKVHWFLMAELEDSEDSEGISRIQEKCQIAATLMGDWPPLIRPPAGSSSNLKSTPKLNRILSSKQRSPSFAVSPPLGSSSPTEENRNNGSAGNDCNGKASTSSEEGKLLKKLLPGPKVLEAFSFRKSAEKQEEESDKDGFFRRLRRDSKEKEDEPDRDGFLRRLLSREKDEELTPSSEGFLKRFFRDKDGKIGEDVEEDGFLRRIFKDKHEERKDGEHCKHGKEDTCNGNIEEEEKESLFRKLFKEKNDEKADGFNGSHDGEDRTTGVVDEEEKEGFFRRLLKDKNEEKKEIGLKNEEARSSRTAEDDDKDGFFRRIFKDKNEERSITAHVKNMDEERASKSADGDEKDGFFRRIFKEKNEEKKISGHSRNEDTEKLSRNSVDDEKDGFFRRIFKDRNEEKKDFVSERTGDEERLSRSIEDDEKDGFLRRIFKEKHDERKAAVHQRRVDEERCSRSADDDEKDGFFHRVFKEKNEEKRVSDIERNEDEERLCKSNDDDEKDGFFHRIFKDKHDEKKVSGHERVEEVDKPRSTIDDDVGKEGFFRRLFKDKHEEKKDEDHDRKQEENQTNGNLVEEESSEFLSFRRLFRVHPEDNKNASMSRKHDGPYDSSIGNENFFRRLFRDRDRSIEDSELFGSKKPREQSRPGSPRQRLERSSTKPPLPDHLISQIRKGTYHASLEFVQCLCDTSYGLVDIFPIDDRKVALRESLQEINSQISEFQKSGGLCFPMGKGMYRVVHIPEDEAVLLNSREKAPYLICVEVLKCESPSQTKMTSDVQKLSRGIIPLANVDVQSPKPPPWAFPLWSKHPVHHFDTDRMLKNTSQAIDQVMAQLWEAKVKIVHVSLLVDDQKAGTSRDSEENDPISISDLNNDFMGNSDEILESVMVKLSAIPGVNMEDVVEQEAPCRKEHRRVPSTIAFEEVKAKAASGQTPPGLSLKGAGQNSPDQQPMVVNGGVPKPSDALSGELWEVKKERIRKLSPYGKVSGWDLCSVIVKSGDDCRQEHLAVQLVAHFYDIYQEAGLPLWLRPYEVIVTSSYTALIETIPDTASIHSIKSRFPNISSLRDYFVAKYELNSSNFKIAQRNFVESMAGYSILCYLLQVKDRHNGNLLIDEEGHIIHIDFGFMLSNSPGGVNFESAPFKLTRELLEVMDSDAEGNPSEFFDYFKVLCIQGFLTCRKHAEQIILIVEMLQDSGFPCFKGGPRTIQNLRKRFHLSLTEEQCVSLVLSLISSSLDAWRTRQYDYYQRVLNGIL
ncbi:phosphatidylinositol 4-kinase beta 1-like [Phalaenopsis equestris]|uniref:phosphatidylinositol 4-kinase beta 1-like n=1 Tax=Phalaenopsis equestris TaxID=78828 RepID=UPI0009E48E06|nr:phosphatidylinositol 4-kinase beta 1-like [Phalaenopsis equestris]